MYGLIVHINVTIQPFVKGVMDAGIYKIMKGVAIVNVENSKKRANLLSKIRSLNNKGVMNLKFDLSIFVILAIGYNLYKFVQLLLKMKQNILLPNTLEESHSIRKDPRKIAKFPTYSNHKGSIIIIYL